MGDAEEEPPPHAEEEVVAEAPAEEEQPATEEEPVEEPPVEYEADDAAAEMQVNDPGEEEPQPGVDAATQDESGRSDAAEAASLSEAEAREVTFVIQPEGYRHSEVIYMNAPIAQIAELLESRLGIPAYSLRFSLVDGSPLARSSTLNRVAQTVRAGSVGRVHRRLSSEIKPWRKLEH